MASRARSKATNKKPTTAGANTHDRKLLAQAEREAERPSVTRITADGLVKISDRCSEALANAESPHGEVGTLDSLLEINLMVWELRWELGLFAGSEVQP
jgi:hypothetical protein